jgi:hypothetical protein
MRVMPIEKTNNKAVGEGWNVSAIFSDQRTRITDFSDQCAHIFLRIIVPVIFSDQCTRVIASGSVYPSVLRISVPVGITDQRTRQ